MARHAVRPASFVLISLALLSVGAGALTLRAAAPQQGRPPIVAPGVGSAPPSDAIVLFDGSDLEGWVRQNGEPATWKLEDGAMTVRGGDIFSDVTFGDAQIHLEFRTPAEVRADDKGRGNSGVYIQGRYEVQILDSFENETGPRGQCGAIYQLKAPLVNVCRKPGEWQSFDIVFRAPRFDAAGEKIASTVITVLHNGVLIHDHVEVPRTTGMAPRNNVPKVGPLQLQDHGKPVSFRNVWIRKLDGTPAATRSRVP